MELNSRSKKQQGWDVSDIKYTHRHTSLPLSHRHTPECGITVIEVIDHRELSYTAIKQK